MKMKVWALMIFFLFPILGCHAFEGMQEVKEKANNGGKRILENVNGYIQRAEIATRGLEKACFSYFKAKFQKGRSNQLDRGMQAQKPEGDKGLERK